MQVIACKLSSPPCLSLYLKRTPTFCTVHRELTGNIFDGGEELAIFCIFFFCYIFSEVFVARKVEIFFHQFICTLDFFYYSEVQQKTAHFSCANMVSGDLNYHSFSDVRVVRAKTDTTADYFFFFFWFTFSIFFVSSILQMMAF